MANHTRDNWDIKVYKGAYSRYKYDVFAVEISSKLIPEAKQVFLYNTFALEFGKKVKPFLALVGSINSSIESEMKIMADEIMRNGKYIEKNIDELLGLVVPGDVVNTYFENIQNYVNHNPEAFAVRGDNSLKTDDESENIYNGKFHLGAFLSDSQYIKKFKTNDGNAALALRIEQFKILADIDMDIYQVKDVVKAFVNKGYILKGEGSSTVEKDLTLSSGNQVRCYVLDLSAEVVN